MAIPPKGDPTRPLHLAVRTSRSLGSLLVVIGILATAPAFVAAPSMTTGWAGLVASLVYFIPGVAFLILAVFIRQGRASAVVCAIALAGLSIASGLLLLFVLFFFYAIASSNSSASTIFWIVGLCDVIFIAAMAQLIIYLSKTFDAIRFMHGAEPRGFEIMTPAPPPH